jgi:sporulation protein YlmC with PRC-barrel domain
MKLKFHLLAAAVVAGSFSVPARAQSDPTHQRFGAEKPIDKFNVVEVKNFRDESLGRITGLGIDLINGRIVEALVVSDDSLKVGNKVVGVPPLALYRDELNEVYRLNVSPEVFASAPAIDLSTWNDATRGRRMAATYRLFGQEPYFLEEGETADPTARWPKVPLGYVERDSKILDMEVGNLQGEKLGKVWSMTLDIPRGRILTVVVRAPGNFKTMSIVPAMALSFNSERSALLLDDTKIEFADEPRYILTEAAYGQKGYSNEESYQGPHTSVALVQGASPRDVDRTVRINRDIRAANLDYRNVEVGTIDGRVTLRGWVDTGDEKRRIGEIAIAASRLELVDNQIAVGRPASLN